MSYVNERKYFDCFFWRVFVGIIINFLKINYYFYTFIHIKHNKNFVKLRSEVEKK